MIADKKKAKEIVLKILKKLKLKPLGSVNKALADPTIRAYLGAVIDKKGRKYFLKVRVQDLETEKRFFWKSHLLGKILNANPNLSFNKTTPKLIDSSYGQGIDYLLYQYVKGEDLGTRCGYDVIRVKMDEIGQILSILRALLQIPAQSFPQGYDRRGRSFFLERFSGCKVLGIEKFIGKKCLAKLEKICQIALFDQYLKFFSHGDFKPNNFIRTKKGIFVVDFEVSSISNQFFDFFSIWGYAIRKPRWRRTLMERFLKQYKFKDTDEHFLFEAEKVLFLMLELGSLLWYFKRNLSKIGIRVARRYLPVRVGELRQALENFKI